MMLEVIRKTLMMTAAVVSSRLVPRIRPAGLSSVSVAVARGPAASPRRPVSNPDRPSASFGKTSSEMPTITQRLE